MVPMNNFFQGSMVWKGDVMRQLRSRRFLISLISVLIFLTGLSPAWTSAWGDTVLVTYRYDRAGRLIQADCNTGTYCRYLYDQAGNLTEHEVTGPVVRRLEVNYTAGGMGSYITLRGNGFPANGYVRLSVNQVTLSPLLQADAAGAFEAVLHFNGSDPGLYVVEALAVPDPNLTGRVRAADQGVWPAVAIFIKAGTPVRAQETQATLVSIPAGLAQQPWSIYLPLVSR